VIRISKKIWRTSIFFIITNIQIFIFAYLYEELEVVYLSWVLVLSTIASFLLYIEIDKLSEDEELLKLKAFGDKDKKYKYGQFLHDEMKMVYDKIIYTFLSLFGILITEIAIMWSAFGTPRYSSFDFILMMTFRIIVGFISAMAFYVVGWMLPTYLKFAEIKNIVVD
jgi:hypothetical protein